MLTTRLYTTLYLIVAFASAQEVVFDGKDVLRVSAGTFVRIEADSAFILNRKTKDFLNKQLDQLDEVQATYNDLVDNRNALLEETESIRKMVAKLALKLESDSATVGDNLDQILEDLEKTLSELRGNNQQLRSNNESLEGRIEELERIRDELKKETRAIWWNGLLDKLVALAGGIGVGILIGSVL